MQPVMKGPLCGVEIHAGSNVRQPQVLRFQDSGQHIGHKWDGTPLRFSDKNDEVMDS